MKRIVTLIAIFSVACLIIASQDAMFINEHGDVEICGNLTVDTVSYAYMPRGGIIMWSGTIEEIPDGWALCDGANGTPDLRDRFILSVAGAEENPGETGGSHSVELGIDNMPEHNHGGSIGEAGNHRHRYYMASGSRSSYAGWVNENFTAISSINGADTGQAGNHSHSLTIYYQGNGTPFDNRPQYYKLAFIIKL